MNRDELQALIEEVQQHRSELDDVEVKSAQKGTPGRMYEALSAFANRPGGGVIRCGLDESRAFEVVGVGDAHRLQAEISHLAASELEPALRPEFTVEQIEGHSVLAVEVNEVPNERKPCFYKPAGLQKGAYIRVGNTNRQMTDYEIFGYVRANGQMANRDYQRLNRVDSVTASRELRGLVEQGLTEQHSTRRWAHYTLRVQPELGSAAEPPTGLALSPTEAKVVAYVRQHGSINNTECRALLSLALKQASHILRRMTMRGALRVQGAKRGARYIVPPIQPNLPSGGPR